MSDLIKLYNPANASALTAEEIEGLQKLTSPEIKELALAYPNLTMQRAYLLIIDSKKPLKKQLPTLSSFENLYNLREKNGLRNFVAYNFRGNYKTKPAAKQIIKARKSEVIDLTDVELLTLPGFKTANTVTEPSEVAIKKIKKIKENAESN